MDVKIPKTVYNGLTETLYVISVKCCNQKIVNTLIVSPKTHQGLLEESTLFLLNLSLFIS